MVVPLMLGGCRKTPPPSPSPRGPALPVLAKPGFKRPKPGPERSNPLRLVKTWAYQIQHLDRDGMVDRLVASKYDMLVLEPTRTDRDSADFDSKGMVSRLHATRGTSGDRRLVLAYIDIGEAESWRYYWKAWWRKPTRSQRGKPNFLVIPDPDGWEDNYPVAFWDARWKRIMMEAPDSMLNKILDDGYDGIYLDWVEAFANSAVARLARQQGKDPAVEMIRFIKQLRAHARRRNPTFLVVAQNGAQLVVGHPQYLQQIDAIAQEQTLFDGGADTRWSDRASCDKRVPATGAGYSQAHYDGLLARFRRAGLPVFVVEYACAAANVKEAYARSKRLGYVPYVTRRPLSRLTTTPPPGY